MVTLCIRLDDIHSGTPPHLLTLLDRDVWRGRPIVLGVVPFPASGCLGEAATRREACGHPRRSLADRGLRTYFDQQLSLGKADIAVHGLTHADHPTAHGPGTPELVAPSRRRVDLLLQVLRAFRDDLGTSTLIPPHNFIDETVAARCTTAGFHLSRALMNHEVQALGLDPDQPEDRAEAKRRRPCYTAGSATVIYQTTSVSPRNMRQNTPREIAAFVMNIAKPAGMGVITFHWWDFLHDNGTINEAFATFASHFLDACQHLGADSFTSIADLARTACGSR
ncbi:hypothetical protein Ga0074812_14321 [Parafrankia irregularis]|uniref:Polysaccharide deacetylase n=1 Tax=Parafrankia irregularis TaxID=795642 RepID=A0A0S4R065_9ACTN|nr:MULTISPECIES: hypothetical protein [Frankiaceae]KPM53145.1 hypothetical protein ACG83_27680 [Frankia sp. R43]MBE3204666.1 hypothetical protein [Parafrankia sp. CH37]CUU60604.1 hypothetical protein Ga0074812_14321 [Parafrankia irregularis]